MARWPSRRGRRQDGVSVSDSPSRPGVIHRPDSGKGQGAELWEGCPSWGGIGKNMDLRRMGGRIGQREEETSRAGAM